jgi:lipoprotein NlpI
MNTVITSTGFQFSATTEEVDNLRRASIYVKRGMSNGSMVLWTLQFSDAEPFTIVTPRRSDAYDLLTSYAA